MYRYSRTGMAMTSPCPAGAPMLAIMSVHLENAPQSPDLIFQHLASVSVAPAQAGGIFLSQVVTEHSRCRRAVPRCPWLPNGQV